jgi:hypothetical protein
MLAVLVVALALAPSASAHTLSIERAERTASGWGREKVNRLGNDYVAYRVTSCRRLYPHQVLCKIGYDTPSTLRADRYACVESWTVFYEAHSRGINYTAYGRPYAGRHLC